MKKSVHPAGVNVPLSANEIERIEQLTKWRGQSLNDWLLLAVLRSIEADEAEAELHKQVTIDPEEGESTWGMQSRFFTPLTPSVIARQLRELCERWYDREDREFDLEEEFELYVLKAVIRSIESGRLTIRNSKPTLN
jgi:hypothetical protein